MCLDWRDWGWVNLNLDGELLLFTIREQKGRQILELSRRGLWLEEAIKKDLADILRKKEKRHA